MRDRLPLFLCSVLWLFSHPARGAFDTCEDARAYGDNTSRLMVGQVFARVACDPDLLVVVQRAFSRVLAAQVLRTNDPDSVKLCYYDGFWDGFATALRRELSSCEASEFACLPHESMAGYGGRLLSALARALDAPEAADAATLEGVFSYALPDAAAAPMCEPYELEVCTDAFRSALDPVAVSAFEPLLDGLGLSLCAP